MHLKLVVVCTIIGLLEANESGNAGNTIINIGGHCANQVHDDNNDKQNEMPERKISTILNAFEQKLKELFETVDNGSKFRDCQDYLQLGYNTTGIYTIFPKGSGGFPVRCDMNGGWTVIQRRLSDSDFDKTWNVYQTGFGNLSNNFWFGNQQIHLITTAGWYELRIDIETASGRVAFAEYNVFSVGNADSQYKLYVDGYSGNAGDSLAYHNGRKFSTKDRDYDDLSGSCAKVCLGAWWYVACDRGNLNRQYGFIEWESFNNATDPLIYTEMKIRRWRPRVES